ncbi:MAG: class I SAM-dependent methyltransferase, partial [Lacrimispora sp.]
MIEKSDRKKVTKEYFDSQAEFYDTSHDGKFVKCMYKEIVKRVMSLPGEKILDLGCGNGNIISLLKEKRKGDYYGADISAKMIQEAKKRLGPDVELKVADVVKLPYETEMFDIIICNASFHHYTEPDKAVEE